MTRYQKNRKEILAQAKRRYHKIKDQLKDRRGREFGILAFCPSRGTHNGNRL